MYNLNKFAKFVITLGKKNNISNKNFFSIECNGGRASNCISCDSNEHRILIDNYCLCEEGYYEAMKTC